MISFIFSRVQPKMLMKSSGGYTDKICITTKDESKAEDWELTRMIAPAHPMASNAGLAGHFDPIYDHRECN